MYFNILCILIDMNLLVILWYYLNYNRLSILKIIKKNKE